MITTSIKVKLTVKLAISYLATSLCVAHYLFNSNEAILILAIIPASIMGYFIYRIDRYNRCLTK